MKKMSNRQMSSDVILIGAGIMSATLGSLLKELAPDWNITVFEKLQSAGAASSNVCNNASTVHFRLDEINRTTEKSDCSIDINNDLINNEKFHYSRQFWS